MRKINGYIKTKQLKKMGVNDRQISKLLKEGQLLKLKQGLYRNTDMFLQDQSFLDVCYAMPNAIISDFSALSYYGFTSHIPQEIYATISNKKLPTRIIYPPVVVFRRNITKFKQNVIKVKRDKYSFRIFDMEKVICDTVKNRNKMGMDTMKEALREYLKRKDRNMPKLYETAEKCKVFDELNEILTVMR